jgi:hypothetical protein
MNKININHNSNLYENLFNMYEVINSNSDSYAFYNILSKSSLPIDLDDSIYDYYKIEYDIPLTILSYNIYNDIRLWWLIMLVNKLNNPVINLQQGSIIKAVKPQYVNEFTKSIKERI